MLRLSTGFIATLVVTLLILSGISAASATEVKESLDVVVTTNNEASASQKKIDGLAGQTRTLLEEFRRLEDGAAYEKAYTRELEELDQAQRAKIDDLQRQISQAVITRQRIVPLMRSMAEALEKFVVLDLPFQQEERIGAVLQLKQRLNQTELSVSAKFRLLLEAYQLEQNYGNTVEAWRGPLQREGEELSVEYLRVGRVALYFQSLDGTRSGYWDAQDKRWVELDSEYNRDLTQALRVAKSQVVPQLLQLPLMAMGASS